MDHHNSYGYSIRLDATALKKFDPLILVEGMINGLSALESRRTILFTIVSELYTNALDHGVLALNHSIKKTAEGFARYYIEREQSLSNLAEGWIQMDIECMSRKSSGEMVFKIRDSGRNINAANLSADADTSQPGCTYGRGLELVRSLCNSVRHDTYGNYIRAVYAW